MPTARMRKATQRLRVFRRINTRHRFEIGPGTQHREGDFVTSTGERLCLMYTLPDLLDQVARGRMVEVDLDLELDEGL